MVPAAQANGAVQVCCMMPKPNAGPVAPEHAPPPTEAGLLAAFVRLRLNPFQLTSKFENVVPFQSKDPEAGGVPIAAVKSIV